MKRYLLFLYLLSTMATGTSGQNFSGQWKGEFTDESSKFSGLGGDRCRYVLDLDVNGKSVTGFSYTYFDEDGKTYYTICRLDGFVDPKRKYIEVTEVERTKTNVPTTVRNCFQVHRLTYQKLGETESIEGSWDPAPRQGGGCGYGNTLLTRRSLANSFPGFNTAANRTSPLNRKKQTETPTENSDKKSSSKSIMARIMGKPEKKLTMSLTPQSFMAEKEEVKTCATPSKIREMDDRNISKFGFLEKRNNNLIRTIEVENNTVRVDLYDNGEIDGDSISVIYDGKLLITHKRLTEKAISIYIPVEDNSRSHELVMYAENLGSIAPNTALMVVTDGDKRHEVRITSDLQKSGTINFVRKPLLGNK